MAVTKEILTLAVETGDALLRNGAEVYRVEDTVLHILKAYEITDCDVYVLSNGIFELFVLCFLKIFQHTLV
jgi:uncharacterized membrane protein YjjP (DUF1212 family)